MPQNILNITKERKLDETKTHDGNLVDLQTKTRKSWYDYF